MSEQMQFLKNLIASARLGNEGAVTLLRDVIRKSADSAPQKDVFRICEEIFRIGVELTDRQIERN